ncbi:MAG TPA: asparagine synthase-related protein [Planctomycetota bacterium]|jgi:hypothetical protein
MKVLIAWQPANVDDPAAVFRQTLHAWTGKYERWTRQKLNVRTSVGDADKNVGATGLIGLIASEDQKNDWIETLQGLAAWAGVCENLPQEPSHVLTQLRENSPQLVELTGRFTFASLHDGQLRVTASSVEPLAAWYVEGPRGWAAGTRVQPLLELVGRSAKPDVAAMSTFAIYGWTVGEHSVFEGVRRVPLGAQLSGTAGKLKIEQHTPLARLFAAPEKPLTLADALAQGAARLKQRVSDEVKLSQSPVLFLSGGRDSRLILAAGASCIPPLTTATYGAADAEEYQCAARVAAAVGAPHRRMEWLSAAELITQQTERVTDYVRWSEGTEKISHLENHLGWFGDERPAQRFTGLGGEINRGGFYSKYFKGMRKYSARDPQQDIEEVKKHILRRRVERMGGPPEARELVQQVFQQVDSAAQSLNADVWLWLDMFYFAERTSHWGADGMSAWSWGGWTWTPFVDRQLIALGRSLTHSQRSGDAWPHGLIETLEPRLGGVPYVGLSWHQKLWRKILGQKPAPMETAAEQAAIFAAFTRIFGRNDAIWPKLVDEKLVREMLSSQDRALAGQKFLWQLATMELLAQTVF